MNRGSRSLIVATLFAAATVAVSADTLYLRNGTRLEGELVAVSDRFVEFRETRGFAGGRVQQYDRDDVLRIDLDRRAVPGRGRGTGRGPGMRERPVTVSANVAWTDTGIDVRSGQEVYFEASGQIRWGSGDRRDGPDGERGSPFNQNRPLPNRPAGALIGKIGRDSRDIFLVGSQPDAIRTRDAGRLFLGINDDVLTDNSGNFRVVIYY